MEHDFIVNVENIDELHTKLGEAKSALDSQIEHIYEQITLLGNSWSGDSYTSFSQKCNEFRPTLDALSALLGGFQTMLNKQIMSTSADANLVKDVASALKMED